MDERTTHDDDELYDIEDEHEDMIDDDDSTSEDSADESNDTSKENSRNTVREGQKKSFLDKLRKGEIDPENIPKDQLWLTKDKDVKEEIERKNKSIPDDFDERISKILTEREAKNEFDLLIEDLQSSKITEEQEAKLKEEFDYILDGYDKPTNSQKLKALLLARRLVGLKDSSELVKERRRKGMMLPPLGSKTRNTVNKVDKKAEIRQRYAKNLPPGFKY